MSEEEKSQHPIARLRTRLGLSQTVFWGAIGVHQAVGSRYEWGRKMPPTVAILVDLAYGERDNSRKHYQKLRKWEKR